MKKTYIFGNWKLHGAERAGHALAAEVAARLQSVPSGRIVALFPPFTSLGVVRDALRGTALALGAQTCSTQTEGAFTGEVSASMLAEAGCRYVLVGHSERRLRHGESNAIARAQAEAALQAGLTPVICVGENAGDREAAAHLDVIRRQVTESIPQTGMAEHYIIAYEPVWAIGSGKVPDAAAIEEAHKTIASCLASATSGRVRALYGGSVKAGNAADILRVPGVDGLLVGGASLQPGEFSAIALA